MDFMTVQTFARFVRQQAVFVVMARSGMAEAQARLQVVRRERLLRDEADHEFWYHAHALVVAAANIAKALWGSSDAAEAARLRLRETLSAEDTWAIKDRRLRGFFEHYDKQLRAFFEAGGGLHVEGFGAAMPGATFWRRYDPATDTLYFDREDAALPLAAVVAEARTIIAHADAALNLCPQCVDQGRPHPVRIDRPRFSGPATYT